MSITTAQGRIYDIDGNKYPSVTTILGILQKPALVPWAAKMTAESFEDQLQEFYEVEECCFVIPDTALPDMLKTAKAAHRAKSGAAMMHGTRVHEAIAFWIEQKGTPDTVEVRNYLAANYPGTEDELDAAMVGYGAFMSWADKNNLEIVSSEQVVTDNIYYAGRYDLVARLNNKVVLIDIKTSVAIYDEYYIQCAAYAYAAFEQLPDAIGILRIDKITGEIEYKERDEYRKEIEAFNNLARAYHSLQALKPEPKPKKEKTK